NATPNGVAILYGNDIENDDNLNVSSVVHSSRIPSDEAGYFEFQNISDSTFLGMYHTEGGQFVKTVKFDIFDVKNRSIPEDLAIYFPNNKSSELSPMIHVGRDANRSYNLLSNPTLSIPYGMSGIPYWSG